jgi:RsiW-degrading membrane proteinase PrsW (M82 family)
MIKGWRTTLHYWSRRGDFLKKAACIIVLASFALSWLIIALMPKEPASITMDPLEQKIRQDWQELRNAQLSQPRVLSKWLRLLLPNLHDIAEALTVTATTLPEYEKSGDLLTYAVRPLIAQHATSAESKKLLEDYVTAYLGDKTAPAMQATQSLQEKAQQQSPPALANELYASLLLREKDEVGAMAAFMREGTQFQEAQQAREKACTLALKLKDNTTLKVMVQSGWPTELPGYLEHRIGAQIRDLAMEWRGLLRDRLDTLRYHELALALLSALLWYFILVQHIPANHWRWLYPVLPLLAGIASIWPTISLVIWQKNFMGITDDVPFPYDVWHLIIGVGLREEVCKLALAALFMPWLVWKRLPGIALITGAFVGLGFALEENLSYYEKAGAGGGVALVRFLTANFMHVAMTGLTTHALYDMLRSRFHRAEQFLKTFFSMVVAHALYDYDFDLPGMQEFAGYVPIIILGFMAWRFWDQVEIEMPHSRQLISPGAVFLLGTALIISCSFLLIAYTPASHEALIKSAMSCVSVLTVTIIYWKRFENHLTRR